MLVSLPLFTFSVFNSSKSLIYSNDVIYTQRYPVKKWKTRPFGIQREFWVTEDFHKLKNCKRKWPHWLFTALLPNPVRFITGGDTEEGVSPGKRGRYVTHSTHSANKQVVTLMRETVAKCFWYNGWQQPIVIPWLEQQGSEGELALMAWTFLCCIISVKQSKQHTQHQHEWQWFT